MCPVWEKQFAKALKERGEEKTTSITTFHLKKSSDCIYNISVQLSHADAAVWDMDIRQISLLQMCEMNCFLEPANLEQDSRYIEGEFECECHLSDPQHCGRAEQLAVKIEEKCGEQPFAKILRDKKEL